MSNMKEDSIKPIKYQGSEKQLKEYQQKIMEGIGVCGKNNKMRRAFTGIEFNEIVNSKPQEMFMIGKDGKSLSYFTYPKLTKLAIGIMDVLKSNRIPRHVNMCKTMFLNSMPSMITKQEACAMEYYRRPLKRLLACELETSLFTLTGEA